MTLFSAIYIEEGLFSHPRVQMLRKKYAGIPQFTCSHYGAVFNRNNQNFRLQKQAPALILAKKTGKYLQSIPQNYGLGGHRHFYFSHLYNCPFDCRYCFLQGFFQSAHFVLFVNFEDFENAIEKEGKSGDYFFTGYDADSLALEPVTGFIGYFLSVFEKHPDMMFEIRTKSVHIRPLLDRKPLSNVIVAFTLSPDIVALKYEKGAPSIEKRLEAITKLLEKGWPVGLRFDPLIALEGEDPLPKYQRLFKDVFDKIPNPHSVTLGAFRLPKGAREKMRGLYPAEPLFFQKERRDDFQEECRKTLLQFLPEEKLFCMH